MEVSQRVSRMHFEEARQALGDLAAELGGDAVHLAQKLVGARIGRLEIRGAAK